MIPQSVGMQLTNVFDCAVEELKVEDCGATLPAMEITINGESREVQSGITVAELLAELGMKPRLVAVERNLQLVPRAQHAECILEPADQLEIVTLVGGG